MLKGGMKDENHLVFLEKALKLYLNKRYGLNGEIQTICFSEMNFRDYVEIDMYLKEDSENEYE